VETTGNRESSILLQGKGERRVVFIWSSVIQLLYIDNELNCSHAIVPHSCWRQIQALVFVLNTRSILIDLV